MLNTDINNHIQDILATVKDHMRRCIDDKDIDYHVKKIEEKLTVVISEMLKEL
jgi:hypothetical protein